MARMIFDGPLMLRLASFATINRIAIATYLRHAVGRRMAADWDANFEIGVRFWRHQHSVAMRHPDKARGRLIYDSLQTLTDDIYEVDPQPCATPAGTWYRPKTILSKAVILHCHGGGYAFHGGISKRFAAMLAHRLGAEVFVPDYRLTPEHPHPAQAEDALSAWHYVAAQVPPERIVLCGDSAGGHMALMLLLALRDKGLPQPALCLGLSPWTDIGARGESLSGNDATDLVQGWMAVEFGRWLDPEGRFGRAALSPIAQDFSGLAPLYLQAGGREVLRDMIVAFAQVQAEKGARVRLDLWGDMPHDFQAYDTLKASSQAALAHLAQVVRAHVDGGPMPARIAGVTVV